MKDEWLRTVAYLITICPVFTIESEGNTKTKSMCFEGLRVGGKWMDITSFGGTETDVA
jgi:hypothetical protein